MNPQSARFFPLMIFAALGALSSALPQPACAGSPLRDQFREHVRARMIQNMEEKPAPEASALATRQIAAPGDYNFFIQQGGLTRLYAVHVPPGYRPSTPSALVFAFHGGGGDMEYMARDAYYGLIPKSDKEGFVLVFPNGFSKFSSGKFATWNAGTCCGDARDRNTDDVGFVKDIVASLTRQMNIDRHRIFAAGMSNGGMMAYRLACDMPDVFKAIASVAGTDNTLQCRPGQPVSILHIHARNDDHVLFDGGAGAGSFKDESKVTEFISVPETITRWVKRDNCSPAPKRVLAVEGAVCDLYSPCGNGAEIKLCVTETGGHSWPGGRKPRGEAPSDAISATDMIWDFFNSRTQNPAIRGKAGNGAQYRD